jgi:hypothetical protein
MMSVAKLGPLYIYGDNMSVIHNTAQRPKLMLKKSNSICYQTGVLCMIRRGNSLLTQNVLRMNDHEDMISRLFFPLIFLT